MEPDVAVATLVCLLEVDVDPSFYTSAYAIWSAHREDLNSIKYRLHCLKKVYPIRGTPITSLLTLILIKGAAKKTQDMT